jgi:hypothetical protein
VHAVVGHAERRDLRRHRLTVARIDLPERVQGGEPQVVVPPVE